MAPRDRPHSHPCAHCKSPLECHGELLRNFDGWPEVICHEYHVQSLLLLCEPCNRQFHLSDCHICGEPSVMTVEDDASDGTGYRGDVAFCEQHYLERVR